MDVRVKPEPQHRFLRVQWDYAERSAFSMLSEASILPGADESEGDPLAMPEPLNGVVGQAEDDLDGAEEPIRVRPAGFRLESLSGGTYDVRATVLTGTGKVCGSARATVMVR